MSPLPYYFCAIVLIAVGAFNNAGATPYIPPGDQNFQKIIDSLQDVAKAVANCQSTDSVLKVAEILRSQQSSQPMSSTVHQPPPQCLPLNNELAIQFGEYKIKFEVAEQQIKELRERLLQMEATSSQAIEKSRNVENQLQLQQEELKKGKADGEQIKQLEGRLLQVETASSQAEEKYSNVESKIQLQQQELTKKSKAVGEQIKQLQGSIQKVETANSQGQVKIQNNEGKLRTLETKVDQATSKNPCRSPFYQVGNDCIYVDLALTLPWHKCREFCGALGGDLVVPSDIHKLRQFLISINKGWNYWIGGSDLKKEGTWLWLNGRQVDRSVGWQSGQPSNFGKKEHCLHYWKAKSFLFNDSWCNNGMRCVCQDARYPK